MVMLQNSPDRGSRILTLLSLFCLLLEIQALDQGSRRVWTLLGSLGCFSLSLLLGREGKNKQWFSWEVYESALGGLESPRKFSIQKSGSRYQVKREESLLRSFVEMERKFDKFCWVLTFKISLGPQKQNREQIMLPA